MGRIRRRDRDAALGAGEVSTIRVDDAPPSTQLFIAVSLDNNPIPGLGTVVTTPVNLLLEFDSTPYGSWQSGPIPGGSGPASAYVQAFALNITKPLLLDLSNAVEVQFTP